MQDFIRRVRHIAPVVLVAWVISSTTAAGQSATAQGQDGQKTPEQVRSELVGLMTALPTFHPNNAGLARRAARIQEQLAALTPEQLAVVAPALSGSEFTGAVARLSVAAQNLTLALQAPLPGAEYDSCGSTRSDTDSGRDLVIASDSLALAAIGGDVVCNTVVTILGEGTNLPGCIAAGVLHVASQAVQFELDLRSYCDSVIDGNEIRGILSNSTVIGANLASHDSDMKAALASHDVDIKALLAILQNSVNEANQRLKVAEALERQTIKLLLTPEGLRAVDPAVMTCTGDNCPKLVACPGTECAFVIKK
jgi:hypothetical protein